MPCRPPRAKDCHSRPGHSQSVLQDGDARGILEAEGIRVITPVYANTNVDVPSLPPEISSMFEDRSYNVVIDVGGDDLGARAVSSAQG